ncbi:uncharacterized protein LOC116841588 isoform X2 [Odontomachus brunneus]|uniref:uncharacterized protein LOC116841588 isoform X2 n=1 Tax=Odontomachus brunneus TaxID=486640 RepID=UPI0013F1FA77|nr:uncharacterized protein LOC116841588 isoform X2 [Odontomachus brunneus]
MLTKLFNNFIKHQKAQIGKHWGSSTIIFKMNSTDTNAVDMNSFTSEEKEKILNIINYQDKEDLLQYSITKKCAQNLALHRANNGQYDSLEELLQVNGMNDKNLYKFYKSIVSGKKKKTPRKVISDLVLTSKVTTNDQKDVDTVLGIYIGQDVISWSLLNRDCEVLQWNYKRFERNRARENIHSLLQTTLPIAANLPKADRYIMQEFGGDGLQKNRATQTIHMEQTVRNAIILSHLAVLNSEFDTAEFVRNNIFILRKNILRKVYQLTVGNETISTQYVLQKLMVEHEKPLGVSLPTVCIKPELQNMYNAQSSINKEQLSWSLLIALGYVGLIVHERTDMRFRDIDRFQKQYGVEQGDCGK